MKIQFQNNRAVAVVTDDHVGEGFFVNAPVDFDETHFTEYALVDGVVVRQTHPTEWLIDIGAFFDRFGVSKMSVLTSTDVGVKAILQDVQIRKWIDLQRADVAQSLAYIGSVVPSVTAELQTFILSTPVAPEENLALRKLYFS